MSSIPVITIDGPGGTGKGTLGLLLARALHWHYLDSGALYRVLAFAAIEQPIELTNEARLAQLVGELNVKFVEQADGRGDILLSGIAVGEKIRTEAIGNAASKIGALNDVRHALLAWQRGFRQPPGLVTDGRDMGTVIFPDAVLKIFLLASAQIRAERRHQQLKAKGINVSLVDLCNELVERDQRDQQRQVAPLVPAAEAIIIDTSSLSVDEVLQQVKRLVNTTLALHIR
jgi:cytidylate kinase